LLEHIRGIRRREERSPQKGGEKETNPCKTRQNKSKVCIRGKTAPKKEGRGESYFKGKVTRGPLSGKTKRMPYVQLFMNEGLINVAFVTDVTNGKGTDQEMEKTVRNLWAYCRKRGVKGGINS